MAQLINKKTNALKYAPENWGDGNVFKNLSHKQIINETLDLIKENVLNNGITVNFHNQNIHFDCLQEKDFSITWMFDDLKKIGANGAYDSNKEMISLGTHLQKNGPKAYGVLYHEMTHHLQHKLIQYIDHYPKDSLEHDYLSLLKYEIEHSVIKGKSFGIEFEGDVYIDKNALSFLSRDSILIDALYRLQVSERNALAVEQASIEFVLSLSKDKEYANQYLMKIKNEQERAMNEIRTTCQASILTYGQIKECIDNAKKNIISRKAPTKNNDIEALITYRIAAILSAQSARTYNEKESARVEYVKQTKEHAIESALNSSYYEQNLYFTMPSLGKRIGDFEFINDLLCKYNEMDIFSASKLELLTEEQQIRNPELIVNALMCDGEKAAKCIKNEVAFKLWYYSDINKLGLLTQNRIAEIMGREYSPEVRQELNTQLNILLQKEYYEHCNNNYLHEDYLQDRFCFDESYEIKELGE